MLPPKSIRELIIKYAVAVTREDSVLIAHTTGVLETGGYKFCGYVGAPTLVNHNNEVVAQVTFNYTKRNKLQRRTPYIISYPNETK